MSLNRLAKKQNMSKWRIIKCLDNSFYQIDWGFDDGGDDVIDFDINVEECGIVLEESNDDVVLLDLPAEQNNGFEIVDAATNGDEHDWKIEEVNILIMYGSGIGRLYLFLVQVYSRSPQSVCVHVSVSSD